MSLNLDQSHVLSCSSSSHLSDTETGTGSGAGPDTGVVAPPAPVDIATSPSSLAPLPSRASPTPSCSNTDHSSCPSIPKRKQSDSQNPKPAKLPKPTHTESGPGEKFANLAFDPYNPHPGMTKEERKLARMIRNRTAAQASRDRKKEHVAELENRVKELEAQVKALSDSSSGPAACPRPCCRALDAIAGQLPDNFPADFLAAAPPPVPAAARTTPTESIDPSIIKLEPSPPSVLSRPPASESAASSGASTDQVPSTVATLELPCPTDPLVASAAPTISPMQSEYLSKIRIHVLEEENAQLKNQLDLETQRASELRYRLLQTRLASTDSLAASPQPPTVSSDDFDLDDGLIGLMLRDSEIENLLTAPLASARPTDATLAAAQSAPQTNSDDSVDWASLLVDPSGPSTPMDVCFSGRSDPTWSPGAPTERALGPPSSLFGRINRAPVTPSHDLHPQSPSALVHSPAHTPALCIPDRRLVAREVKPSPQRIGWGTLEGQVRAGQDSVERRLLWQASLQAKRQPACWLVALVETAMCFLISCWVAWSRRTAGERVGPRARRGRAGLVQKKGGADYWRWSRIRRAGMASVWTGSGPDRREMGSKGAYQLAGWTAREARRGKWVGAWGMRIGWG